LKIGISLFAETESLEIKILDIDTLPRKGK
jgi:hypothetical protein